MNSGTDKDMVYIHGYTVGAHGRDDIPASIYVKEWQPIFEMGRADGKGDDEKASFVGWEERYKD